MALISPILTLRTRWSLPLAALLLSGGDDPLGAGSSALVDALASAKDLPSSTSLDAIGREVAVPTHLLDGDEYVVSTSRLLEHGEDMFTAVFTPQEGGGRPLTKGTSDPLSDPSSPLVFPNNFNQIFAMDSNACASCHSVPLVGGGGHFSANAFIPGQRFDFLTFDQSDLVPTRGARDAGRDALLPGGSVALSSKGISFGTLARDASGAWDTSAVEGLPPQSLTTEGADSPPTVLIWAFHQAATVISIRQFTNNAFNHHHGIQTTERFGADTDADGDGIVNEASRADVTATVAFQASLAVPGRVIPNLRMIEDAVLVGERRFEDIGWRGCRERGVLRRYGRLPHPEALGRGERASVVDENGVAKALPPRR